MMMNPGETARSSGTISKITRRKARLTKRPNHRVNPRDSKGTAKVVDRTTDDPREDRTLEAAPEAVEDSANGEVDKIVPDEDGPMTKTSVITVALQTTSSRTAPTLANSEVEDVVAVVVRTRLTVIRGAIGDHSRVSSGISPNPRRICHPHRACRPQQCRNK